MSKIIFYLSDHGYGHAARNIPIMEELLMNGHEVIVKTGQSQSEFVRDSLKQYDGIEVIAESMDIGLVLKSSSFEIDAVRLEEKLRTFIGSWPSRIEEEVTYLKDIKPDLVLSDIVPWVLKASKEVGIKSCLISNFTWVEIYKEHLSEEIIVAYQNCYELVDEVLRYDLATPYMSEFFKDAKEVSVCAREFHESEAMKIQSQYEKPIVFVSVGRSVDLEEAIDVSQFDYQFIVTEGIQLLGENVVYLPKEVENTQDYILASKMVITKAGFGTVAETMLAKKKCGVIGRERVAEDRATVQHLVERGLAVRVEYSGGLDMEEIIHQIEAFEPRYDLNPFTNDAKKIAKMLAQMASSHYLMELSAFGNEEMGYLIPLDGKEFPFEVKRIFYLVDVPQDALRGKHAYHKTKQVLVCVHGSVKVKCTIGEEEVVYELQDSKKGLYLAPDVWREAYEFSEGAVLLVASSQEYSEGDYKR